MHLNLVSGLTLSGKQTACRPQGLSVAQADGGGGGGGEGGGVGGGDGDGDGDGGGGGVGAVVGRREDGVGSAEDEFILLFSSPPS